MRGWGENVPREAGLDHWPGARSALRVPIALVSTAAPKGGAFAQDLAEETSPSGITPSRWPVEAKLPFDALSPVGTVVDGKYRVDAVLGRGSMGDVYRATHLQLAAPVALKVLPAGETPAQAELVARFEREAVAASRMGTDHVVRVLDSGESPEGVRYLVMELLEGRDLEQMLADGPLDVARGVHVALQVLRGLDVAHAAGVVHRDLKPANLFLTERDGEALHVKILDFGISKLEGDGRAVRLTQRHIAMGTPLYMAPEQIRDASSVGPAADLYAAAAVLYECLAGSPPLEGQTSAELLTRILDVVPERLDHRMPAVPAGLADVIAAALAKDPADRPSTATEFAQRLAPFAAERSVRALASLRIITPPKPVRVPPELSYHLLRSLPGAASRRTGEIPVTRTGTGSVPTPPLPPSKLGTLALPAANWALVAFASFVMTLASGLWAFWR